MVSQDYSSQCKSGGARVSITNMFIPKWSTVWWEKTFPIILKLYGNAGTEMKYLFSSRHDIGSGIFQARNIAQLAAMMTATVVNDCGMSGNHRS